MKGDGSGRSKHFMDTFKIREIIDSLLIHIYCLRGHVMSRTFFNWSISDKRVCLIVDQRRYPKSVGSFSLCHVIRIASIS